MSNEQINVAVRAHEVSTEWHLKDMAMELYRFFELFNIEYFSKRLPLPLLTFKKSRQNNLGHFLSGRNDIGAQYEINLNSKHITRPLILSLVTLLHEMCHLAQDSLPGTYGEVGSGNHHGKQFIELTTKLGIPSTSRGVTEYVSDIFIEFCVRNGAPKIDRKDIEKGLAAIGKKKGNSKLKKWCCACDPVVNVRVAIEDFSATCNVCHSKFKLEE